MTIGQFRKLIWDHYRKYGRHDLAWRKAKNPYRILVSEIMLQQTQVSRVTKFYLAFIKQFPSFEVLATAKTADVLRAWQGLGYNRRALALQRLAQTVVGDYKGKLPSDRASLEALPGIGKGTSGSLMAFAFNKPEAFIETNIRRAFIHYFFSERQNVSDKELEPLIAKAVDLSNPREWYWALMDYGSTLGAAKDIENPNLRSKHYVRQSKFAGSDRELRGKILRVALRGKKLIARNLARSLGEPLDRTKKILAGLSREGFI